MVRTFIHSLIFTIILLPILASNSYAIGEITIDDCDELVALNRDYSGKMLCWYEHDNTKGTYTYSGKLYQKERFFDLKDDDYVSRRHNRSFRGENGYVLFHKNRAYLVKENKKSPDIFAEFYEANFEGLQRVYICNHNKLLEKNICGPAEDKKYTTRNNVEFETKDGFLPAGCHYENSGLICEDLN